MKSKDNRGESWSEIVIHGNKTSVHGEVIGKKKIQYTVSLNEREGDTFIGKMVSYIRQIWRLRHLKSSNCDLEVIGHGA